MLTPEASPSSRSRTNMPAQIDPMSSICSTLMGEHRIVNPHPNQTQRIRRCSCSVQCKGWKSVPDVLPPTRRAYPNLGMSELDGPAFGWSTRKGRLSWHWKVRMRLVPTRHPSFCAVYRRIRESKLQSFSGLKDTRPLCGFHSRAHRRKRQGVGPELVLFVRAGGRGWGGLAKSIVISASRWG